MTDKKCTGPDASKPEPCPDFKRKPIDLTQFEGHTPGPLKLDGDTDLWHIGRGYDAPDDPHIFLGSMACGCNVCKANANLWIHATAILAYARELEAEVEKYHEWQNDDENHYLAIAQDAQSHAADLAGAFETAIEHFRWTVGGEQHIDAARAALAKWKEDNNA